MKRKYVYGYKTSPIDKQRAVKATPELRDEWFGRCEAFVRKLHAAGKIPWATYNEIPDRCKYGFDEEAANTCKGRAKALRSRKVADDGMRRLFEISSDGRMSKHVTDGMTTRADGKVCAPYLLKARGGGNAKADADKRRAGQAVPLLNPTNEELHYLLDSDYDVDADAADSVKIGLGITRSGSMTLETFFEFAQHFNRYVIDADQGGAIDGVKEGGQPVILFLDGHASRWSSVAHHYFMRNNIHVICVPSHTTIWSQPNDAGSNASFKACFGRVLRSMSCAVEAAKGGDAFNKVFRAAFLLWRKEMSDALQATQMNAVKSAWRKVGLGGKLNPHCEMWTAAIGLFGDESLLQQSLKTIQDAVWKVANVNVDDAEEAPAGAHIDGTADDDDVDAAAAAARAAACESRAHLCPAGLSAREAAQHDRADRLRTALEHLETSLSLEALGAERTADAERNADDAAHGERVVDGERNADGERAADGAVADEAAMAVESPNVAAPTATAVASGDMITIIVHAARGEAQSPAISISRSQLQDPQDSTVLDLCARFQLAAQPSAADASNARARARASARDREMRRAAAQEEGLRRREARLEQARSRLEAAVLQHGKLDDDTWAEHRKAFEEDPVETIDTFKVAIAADGRKAWVFSQVLTDAVGNKLAERAATVMEEAAAKATRKGKAKGGGVNTYAGQPMAIGMAEHGANRGVRQRNDEQVVARQAEKAKEKAALAQQKADEAAQKLERHGFEALQRLVEVKAGKFEALSRRDQSRLIRWYDPTADVPRQPPDDPESDADLLQKWIEALGDHDPEEDLAWHQQQQEEGIEEEEEGADKEGAEEEEEEEEEEFDDDVDDNYDDDDNDNDNDEQQGGDKDGGDDDEAVDEAVDGGSSDDEGGVDETTRAAISTDYHARLGMGVGVNQTLAAGAAPRRSPRDMEESKRKADSAQVYEAWPEDSDDDAEAMAEAAQPKKRSRRGHE